MRVFTITSSGSAPSAETSRRGSACQTAWQREVLTGASLPVGVIFLVIMTILGLMALRVATLEERMSGNASDRSLAFQAAEAALRDAELDVQCLKYNKAPATTFRPNVGLALAGATGPTRRAPMALLQSSGLVCGHPDDVGYAKPLSLSDASVPYGTLYGGARLAGVAGQPRYLIEPFLLDSKNYYRITARGFGLDPTTQVTLQEVFRGVTAMTSFSKLVHLGRSLQGWVGRLRRCWQRPS